MSLEAEVYYFKVKKLFRVLRSQTLIEPLLDPTMTCSSDWVKVSEVSAEGLVLLRVSTAMGLGDVRL